MEQSPTSDHCGDVIRLIDHVLAEESVVLEGLKQAVAQNGITEQELIQNFSAFRRGLRRQRDLPDDAA